MDLTKPSNNDNALSKLNGILSGIATDRVINENELVYLDVWIREHQNLAHDGDVLDLLDHISDVLDDGIITQEEMRDTLQLIDDILEYQENPPQTSDIEVILGFAAGLVSDGSLNRTELSSFKSLLQQNDDEGVYRLLLAQINAYDDEDRLIDIIKHFSGQYFQETGSVNEWPSTIADAIPEGFDFSNKKICFTGQVTGIPRSTLKRQSELLGCVNQSKVSSKTDILIIGDVSSKDWMYSSLGRKIEKAYNLKGLGHPIHIFNIEDWLAASSSADRTYGNERNNLIVKFGDILTIQDILTVAKKHVEGLPITAQESICSEEGHCISLHKQWKNGKPQTSMQLFIRNNENSGLTKTWFIGGKLEPTRSYSHKDNAIEYFKQQLSALILSHRE